MHSESHIEQISKELKLKASSVKTAASLLEEGNTVPFIARYRKEMTGSMDEVSITSIRDRLAQLTELDKRRTSILSSLKERELLTAELEKTIDGARNMTVLEDLYLPYRPKRRTRATMARERGLEPLASLIFEQKGLGPRDVASAYVDSEGGVEDADQALQGASDIIAERISEDRSARNEMRMLFVRRGSVNSSVSSGKEEEGAKYSNYFEWKEPLSATPSHRILAMFRGERENILSIHVAPPENLAIAKLDRLFVKGNGADSLLVRDAVEDGYKRLLASSMETEARKLLKKKADLEAIAVFVTNLRELLMSPPLGSKRVLALDPGFRTGCKAVCLNKQGDLLHFEAIFPHPPRPQREKAAEQIRKMVEKFDIEAIAIGNGTAGRETEAFIQELSLPEEIVIAMVNESGASVYSASPLARKEFPDQDVTVRGAVSIGRRLMDPLAELVKIDPKSIGVGQYQHDVDQKQLRQALDDVVVSCVNSVGVEVNTASSQLLTYVSGLGPQLAENIVRYREENGPFRSRSELKKVSRLGPKAFEQSAGFLRIRGGKNPLDASAVHPDSYGVVKKMAADLGCTVEDLMKNEELRKRIVLEKYISEKIGMPTLEDIMRELAKPGRDPRDQFEAFTFAEEVNSIEDLRKGMSLPGIVTNVTAFGAFIDIGVHQDGLVHISQLADRFVKHPSDIVKPGQKVTVTVTEIDLPRRRISLSMKKDCSATETKK